MSNPLPIPSKAAQSAYGKSDGIEGALSVCEPVVFSTGIAGILMRFKPSRLLKAVSEVMSITARKPFFPTGDIVVMNCDVAHTGSSLNDAPMSYRMFYNENLATVYDKPCYK
jgi:hypothetical protein